jgi:hypothetical protein
MPTTDQQPISRKHRQGTDVRRRDALVGVRLTTEEYEAIRAAADQQQRSPASLLREAFFGGEQVNRVSLDPARGRPSCPGSLAGNL